MSEDILFRYFCVNILTRLLGFPQTPDRPLRIQSNTPDGVALHSRWSLILHVCAGYGIASRRITKRQVARCQVNPGNKMPQWAVWHSHLWCAYRPTHWDKWFGESWSCIVSPTLPLFLDFDVLRLHRFYARPIWYSNLLSRPMYFRWWFPWYTCNLLTCHIKCVWPGIPSFSIFRKNCYNYLIGYSVFTITINLIGMKECIGSTHTIIIL